MQSAQKILPAIRQDLKLQQGAPTLNGQATWLIYDPVRHKYFSLSERVFRLISLWSETTADDFALYASDVLEREVSLQEIDDLIHFFYSNNLSDTPPDDDPFSYARQTEAANQSIFSKLLHSYLFFRIPVWRPEAFLNASYPFVRPLFSPTAIYLYLTAFFIGLYFVSRQWDGFTSTFLHFFTFEGAILYAISLVLIKTLHEMGHAYMAHRYGVRVNTMGIAFLVMLPVLYTDVTNAWSLKSRRQKLMIDGAGMFVELIIAAIATLFWVFLPDGPIRSAAFLLATTSWILSLFVNLNPFMRFDGYYILSDAWGMPNLQPRAFAQARWWMRELLFGLGEQAPEPFQKRTRALLIAYAIATWIYRVILFIGIALVVYHMFFKLLGIALFVVEIMFFILLPIWHELKNWWKIREKITRTRRSVFTASIGAFLVGLMIAPWNSTIRVPAIATAKTDLTIYSSQAARLIEIKIHQGQLVKKGDLLISLDAPLLTQRINQTRTRIKLLRARIARTVGDRKDLSDLQVLMRQLNTETERLTGLKRELSALQIRAPESGQIKDLDADLHPGRWVNQKNPLFRIIGQHNSIVKGYVKEDLVWRLTKGQVGVFVPDDPQIQQSLISLENISPTGTSTLDNLYLASTFGGSIATIPESDKSLRMTEARHVLSMTTDLKPGVMALRGVVLLEGEAESIIASVWRQIMRVMVREAFL